MITALLTDQQNETPVNIFIKEKEKHAESTQLTYEKNHSSKSTNDHSSSHSRQATNSSRQPESRFNQKKTPQNDTQSVACVILSEWYACHKNRARRL